MTPTLQKQKHSALAVFIALMPLLAQAADPKSAAKNAEPANPPPGNVTKAIAPFAGNNNAKPPAAALPTPGGLSNQQFNQLQQARDMKQMKDALGAGKLGGIDTSRSRDIGNLTNTDLSRPGNRLDQLGKAAPTPGNSPQSNNPYGNVPMPSMPNNRDHAPRGAMNGMPTTNLRDIGKGTTRSPDSWDRHANEDNTSRAHGGIDRTVGNNGVRGYDTGTGRDYETHREVHYRDGTHSTEHHVHQATRDGLKSITTYTDPEGRTTTVDTSIRFNNEAPANNAPAPGPAPETNPRETTQNTNRLPSSDTPSGGGHVACNPFTGVCFGQGPKNPNQVNPGHDGGVSDPKAPTVQLDRKLLVTNPDMNAASGGKPPELERGNPVNRVNPPNPRTP
jgi:hypothetical protein